MHPLPLDPLLCPPLRLRRERGRSSPGSHLLRTVLRTLRRSLDRGGGGGATERSPADSLYRRRTVDSLLTVHGITRAGYDSTVGWYNADPHRWRAVMDSVTHTRQVRLPVNRLPRSPPRIAFFIG
ncbi:MAG: DUF4296 domain-containing protein [Ignavibacteriales bacterium]|nr:DUF4296 domain-containing protein [Ignavibacteriales bacterium]